jgi:hypothetical protein
MNEIEITRPSRDELEKMGVFSWPIWEKEVSTFPWHYDADEICYILEGQVTVQPKGGQSVEIRAGDLVKFPKGMDCVWEVTEPIRKHYRLDFA